LAEARRATETVHIVADSEAGADRATQGTIGGSLTWHFQAHDVRDFAFGTSNRYLWDALPADAGNGQTALIQTFYRPMARGWDWVHAARDGQFSIQFLSHTLWPYPYSQMTLLDGPHACAGMEYPMITCIGGPRDSSGLFSVVAHELGHMWFPMQVGSDERRSPWMDEGLTRYNQIRQIEAFYPGVDRLRATEELYEAFARSGSEIAVVRPGDEFPPADFSDAYFRASYEKPAVVLTALRAILGDSLFDRAFVEYGRRWVNKHPTPYDFWNTFDAVTGQDLSWFWRTWWFETWTLDQAIGAVHETHGGLLVEIDDRGMAPMPVRLTITRRGGQVERRLVPVTVWMAGARQTTVTIADAATVERIEIDPERRFPLIDRSNTVWTRR
jgi:hypothetical protein